ncbi:MAG TPA: DUF1461 domain-containing protein [Candidatus Limnocylindrales bacterium]|jgi:integral membrane protein (TIGR01906 family)
MRRRVAFTIVLGATPVAIVALTLLALFNPVWINPAQQRAGVAAMTGFDQRDVERVTGSILSDVVIGPPSFDVAVDGVNVLGEAERGHMRDVYRVLRAFMAIAVAGGLLTVVIARRLRSDPVVWRAIAVGSGALLVAGVVLSVIITFLFDAFWLAFHLVFFPQGNFSFDPTTQRLTQLFPDQFWVESATAAALVAMVLAGAVTLAASRRARHLAHAGCLATRNS